MTGGNKFQEYSVTTGKGVEDEDELLLPLTLHIKKHPVKIIAHLHHILLPAVCLHPALVKD